jgi:hypothetical protein
VLRIGEVEVREKRPHVYQKGHDVEGRFVRRGHAIGFEVANYDRSRVLTIDPVLTYSTYLGGSGNTANQSGDYAYAVAMDAQGNAIVVGATYSTNFPTKNGLYTEEATAINAFIAKLNPAGANGASLIWSTYLGGNTETQAYGVAVDSQSNVYVTGATDASNFPLMNAFQNAPASLCKSSGQSVLCQQGFVTKISSGGNQLVYSSYLGGANNVNAGNAIAVDRSGDAWVAGSTEATDFPATSSSFQDILSGGTDGFVSMVNPSGSQLVFSSYIGGGNTDNLLAIAVDSAGNAYVAGYSYSINFPLVNAYQAALPEAGARTSVVAKINPNATSPLVYSTFLGGSNAGGFLASIAVDAKGNIYVAGRTEATNFPVTANALQTGAVLGSVGSGNIGATVAELNPAAQGPAQLVYSSYLSGGSFDEAYAIGLDSSGRIVVGGNTQSPNFPTTPNAFQTVYSGDVTNGSSTNKAFLSIVDPSVAGINGLVYSTLYGGSQSDTLLDMALNAAGTTATIVGSATSSDLFVTPSAYQPALSSQYGAAFIATFNLAQSGPVVAAMTNAASFAAGNTTFAPGEIVTLFGTNLGPQTLVDAELDPNTGLLASTLAGCQFVVNGTPTPLVYVQADQVSAILPYELTPNIGASLISYGQMVCNSVPGNVFEFSVVAANPGIFAAAGTTQGAILNQDGSYNTASNPAAGGNDCDDLRNGRRRVDTGWAGRQDRDWTDQYDPHPSAAGHGHVRYDCIAHADLRRSRSQRSGWFVADRRSSSFGADTGQCSDCREHWQIRQPKRDNDRSEVANF